MEPAPENRQKPFLTLSYSESVQHSARGTFVRRIDATSCFVPPLLPPSERLGMTRSLMNQEGEVSPFALDAG